MNLSEILKSEELSNAEKLTKVSTVVKEVRELYGNKEVTIEVPDINTSEGLVPLNFLSDEDKVALASITLKEIIVTASEECRTDKALVLDRIIEEGIAVNAVLANLAATTGSKFF